MNRTLHEHLNAEQCERFLESNLSMEEEQSVISHLDTCEACRLVLEQSAGSPDWWSAAHTSLQDSSHAPLSEERVRCHNSLCDPPRLVEQLQHILVASDDPQMLGRIGNYEIVGVIGRGGTGIVVKAWERSLDRFVAIKVLTAELSSVGAARERFHREARAAAAIRHENVIPIYAVSEFRGHAFLVMQYVPGKSLEQRIHDEGTLEVTHVVRIAMQIARGLSAAHAQGLVHRDIKPGNILLEEGIDRPIVTDLGLARVASDASLTQSGTVTGTPNYMSPEQASSQPVDGRSDLFSLGSVIYAMCTGHAPFRSDSLLGVLRRVVEDEPSPVRQHNPAIPLWLEAFIRRLLCKSLDERFASAAEVADLLSAELAHLQNPLGYPQPPRTWWPASSRRRLPRAGYVAIGLLGTTVLGGTLLQSPLRQVLQTTSPHRAVAPAGSQTAGDPIPFDMRQWDRERESAAQAIRQLENSLEHPRLSPSFDAWSIEVREAQSALVRLENDSP